MSAKATSSDKYQYEIQSAVRGFHIYKDGWEPEIGEQLVTERETNNEMDKHAVAVLKNGHIVGHLPREKAKIFWFFLKRHGIISVTVTDKRRVSKPAGGLEVPCKLTFTHTSETMIDRLTKLL